MYLCVCISFYTNILKVFNYVNNHDICRVFTSLFMTVQFEQIYEGEIVKRELMFPSSRNREIFIIYGGHKLIRYSLIK